MGLYNVRLNYDYLIVLGYMCKDNKPNKILIWRLDLAAQIIKKFNFNKIILSGGVVGRCSKISQAKFMSDYLVNERGIISNNFILEEDANKTTENFYQCIKKGYINFDEVGIGITSKFHINRSKLIAKSFCMNIEKWYGSNNNKNIDRIVEPFKLIHAKRRIYVNANKN